MMATKRTWIWIVVGAIGLIVLAFIAFAASIAYIAMSTLEIRDSSAASVAAEFETARRPFAGQQPLVTLDDIHSVRPRLTKRPLRQAATRKPETIHIMAFDADDAKVMRLKLPFWILRLGTTTNVQLGDEQIEVSKLGVTVSDLEQHGPGLVLDYSGKDGHRLLLWTE